MSLRCRTYFLCTVNYDSLLLEEDEACKGLENPLALEKPLGLRNPLGLENV